MSVEDMPDEVLVRYFENVRQQVEADRAGNHKFMMQPFSSTPINCKAR